jgi:hypothetical protein
MGREDWLAHATQVPSGLVAIVFFKLHALVFTAFYHMLMEETPLGSNTFFFTSLFSLSSS